MIPERVPAQPVEEEIPAFFSLLSKKSKKDKKGKKSKSPAIFEELEV
jgi:hypothetical protein